MQNPSPAEIVQAQLDAYNSKNIEALLKIYSSEAVQYLLNGEQLAAGREQLRKRFLERFSEPDLSAKLLTRIVMGNLVTDHELISRNFPEGKGTVEMLCIYEVNDGKIVKATFAVGEKHLNGIPNIEA